MKACLLTSCMFLEFFGNGNLALSQTSTATIDSAAEPACKNDGIVSYDPVVYDAPVSKCLWRRPENVIFVYLQGCGGGAGGQSKGDPNNKKWKDSGLGIAGSPPGVGGGASEFTSIVIGPLTQDTYEISVGDVAGPDAGGNATSFSGGDAKVLFRGGSVGAGSGRNSPLETGGSSVLPQISTMGGDASLEAGGNGATYFGANLKNATDGGRCAGGGGGSTQGFRNNLSAGKGGAGYLMVIPLAPFNGVIPATSASPPPSDTQLTQSQK